MRIGDRVRVVSGGFRGKLGTLVAGPQIPMQLCIEGLGTVDCFVYDMAKEWPGQVFVEFDEDLGGGEHGTGIFRFTKKKLCVAQDRKDIGR